MREFGKIAQVRVESRLIVREFRKIAQVRVESRLIVREFGGNRLCSRIIPVNSARVQEKSQRSC